METTQRDRDALREAQQKLLSDPAFIIGNLVEHKIQDPAKYKTLSRQEQGLPKDAKPSLPKIDYKSKYLSTINDTSEKEYKLAMPTANNAVESSPSAEEIQANLWLNMDRVEFDKLEWMSEKAEKEFQERLKSTTHFDNQGKAIQPSDGDPQQEVHDIESLVKLLDSTFQPQITYALNVISKIATRATIGLYDAVFDENIHQVLIKECLLRVRHHMDSQNETICQSALKCLRALICNTQVDEIFNDKLYPLKSEESNLTMWLMTELDDFEADLKDNECIALDAILALMMRTDILKRFKYLLSAKNNPKFSHTYHDCILDLLIRFARYSRGMCWILNSDDFPRLLIELFLPADIVLKDRQMQSLALRSLKFLRIVAQASREFKYINCRPGGKDLKLTEKVLATINTYYYLNFSKDQTNEDVPDDLIYKINIETLRLMKSLAVQKDYANHVFSAISLNQASLLEHVKSFIRLSVLKEIKSPCSLDWQYVAALIDLLGSMMEHERYNTSSTIVKTLWTTYVRPQTMQWFNDLIRERLIPHQDISIALAAAVQQFDRCKDEKFINELQNLILGKPINKDPKENPSWVYYNHLVREAATSSQLSSFLRTSGRLRDPIMLPSYGYMDLNTSDKYEYRLSSVISIHTPFILLGSYFAILQKAGSRLGHLVKHYVNNINLVRYMRSSACYYKYPLNYEVSIQQSPLAQLEIRLLSNACLFLSGYCLSGTDLIGTRPPIDEPADVAESRVECYSQLLLDTISVIGLINPEIEHMNEMKDKLLENIMLNEIFHARLMSESHLRKGHTLLTSYQNYQFELVNRRNSANFKAEGLGRDPVDLFYLKPVYMNCEQPGRFWIFQPLIEYHSQTINDGKICKDNRWFTKSIAHNMLGRPLPADCTDMDVLGTLLRFNTLLMQHSPAYFQLAVKPNIEEYLCLMGSIFLHDGIFLDPKVSRPLSQAVEVILTEGLRQGVDRVFSSASQKISTLGMTLMDFFNKLVDQYEAASYNDVVFSNFLLLFMTPKCDKAFRRVLFSDKVETCLRQMNIGPEQVWIPTELITKEKEPDAEIRSLIKLSAPYTIRSSYLDSYRRFHTSP